MDFSALDHFNSEVAEVPFIRSFISTELTQHLSLPVCPLQHCIEKPQFTNGAQQLVWKRFSSHVREDPDGCRKIATCFLFFGWPIYVSALTYT